MVMLVPLASGCAALVSEPSQPPSQPPTTTPPTTPPDATIGVPVCDLLPESCNSYPRYSCDDAYDDCMPTPVEPNQSGLSNPDIQRLFSSAGFAAPVTGPYGFGSLGVTDSSDQWVLNNDFGEAFVSMSISPDTMIMDYEGYALTSLDLYDGLPAMVWCSVVRESYPAQCDAAAIFMY